MKPRLFFNWALSDHFGWGTYGLNLLVQSLALGRYDPVPLFWPAYFAIPPDPLLTAAMNQAAAHKSEVPSDRDIQLRSLGNSQEDAPGSKDQIGVTFFELNPPLAGKVDALKAFRAIIAGSTWNYELLREFGVDSRLVIQGVDTDRFRPRPKRFFGSRFVVFAGGKLEFRKGQDLVVKAFSIFAKSRPEALLMAAWRSPFESNVEVAETVNMGGLLEPFKHQQDFGAALSTWLESNGIARSQYHLLPLTSNWQMPEIFREVDCALFPNRCESGTNLVLMEALSSGVPCVVSQHTGHLDVMTRTNCIALERQHRLVGAHLDGWYQSEVEEIVAALERVYDGRAGLDPQVVHNSMLQHDWRLAIERLTDTVEALHGESDATQRPHRATA